MRTPCTRRNKLPLVRMRLISALRRTALSLPKGARRFAIRWLRALVPVWDRLISADRESADVYLLSFPKTGRTWLRTMVGRVLQQHYHEHDVSVLDLHHFNAVNREIPKIWVDHDDNPQFKAPEELEVDKSAYQGKKVIFLARDPRDVVISLYFHMKKRRRFYEGDLAGFLGNKNGSIDTILRYYNIWAAAERIPESFLLVRYEDIHQDPHRELRRVLDFVGIHGVSDDVIDDAVRYASFSNMRQMEMEDAFDSNKLRAADKSDQDSFKTRKGEVAGYHNYLTAEQIAALDAKIDAQLHPRFKYTTVERSRETA